MLENSAESKTAYNIGTDFSYMSTISVGTGDFKQLLYASRDGNLDDVKHWLQYDADPNFLHPEFMFTPLHISLRNGHLDVARYLLENGADPHLSEGHSDNTPLSIALANNDHDAVALLKSFGVEDNINRRQAIRQKVWSRLMRYLSY